MNKIDRDTTAFNIMCAAGQCAHIVRQGGTFVNITIDEEGVVSYKAILPEAIEMMDINGTITL